MIGIAFSDIRAIVLVGFWFFDCLGVVCISDTSARLLNSGSPCFTYVQEVVVVSSIFVYSKSITLSLSFFAENVSRSRKIFLTKFSTS